MTPRPPRRGDLRITAGGAWMDGRRLPCVVGRAGIGAKRGEGDGVTPVGVWRLDAARWRADRRPTPRTILPLRPIGAAHGWSDDPRDPLYNAPCPWPHAFSAERMRRRDRLYDLVAQTDFNRSPIRPGAGSAIFLHVWKGRGRPTEGCVAFAAADLAWILARWRAWRRVVIQP
ncbi:MAG: L,D-transpeptidase family protein [Pseudomonadota bacterium]